jgi:hypothetical protein
MAVSAGGRRSMVAGAIPPAASARPEPYLHAHLLFASNVAAAKSHQQRYVTGWFSGPTVFGACARFDRCPLSPLAFIFDSLPKRAREGEATARCSRPSATKRILTTRPRGELEATGKG